jgi:hypothetical protein
MLQIHVSKRLWSYGVLTAVYLINRLPIRVLDFKSPLEVLQITSPKLAHLKVFECSCFVHLPSSKRDKLDSRAVKCIFLGYSQTQRDTDVMIPHKKKCMYQEMLYLPKILLITLPHVKKRMILTCFRCLVQLLWSEYMFSATTSS